MREMDFSCLRCVKIRQALAPEASAMVVVVDPEEGLLLFFSLRHQVSIDWIFVKARPGSGGSESS